MAPDKDKRTSLIGLRVSSIFNNPGADVPLLRTALNHTTGQPDASIPARTLSPQPGRARRKPPPDLEPYDSQRSTASEQDPQVGDVPEETPPPVDRTHLAPTAHTKPPSTPNINQPVSHPAQGSPLRSQSSRNSQMLSPNRSHHSNLLRSPSVPRLPAVMGLLDRTKRSSGDSGGLADIVQTLELEIDNFHFGEKANDGELGEVARDTYYTGNIERSWLPLPHSDRALESPESESEGSFADNKRNPRDASRGIGSDSWENHALDSYYDTERSSEFLGEFRDAGDARGSVGDFGGGDFGYVPHDEPFAEYHNEPAKDQGAPSHSQPEYPPTPGPLSDPAGFPELDPVSSAPYPIDSPVVPLSPSKSKFYFPDDDQEPARAASQASLTDMAVKPSFSAASTGLTGASSTLTDNSSLPMAAPISAPAFHRKSTSLSSIYSSSSNRNVNLANLKRTLDLKPGEGETSRYVVALRKSMGTACNDSPPDKWKLPTGILPVDKRAILATSNGRYLRLGVSQGRKKTSGVELKHGHLQRRLLAAEVGDSQPYLGGNALHSALSSSRNSRASIYSGGSVPVSGTSNPGTGQSASSSSSPTRSQFKEDASVRSLAVLLAELAALGADMAPLGTSSPAGSIDDLRGYYQHPSYQTGSDDDTPTDAEQYAEEPRLVLVNPDSG